MKNKIIAKRSEDYSQWYLDVIEAADLADSSPVRGCIVFKPNGYAIWEKIRENLDNVFKKIGVQNMYFPLFIPKSFLEKEAKHIEGFAKECAVVTHHRLESDSEGKLIPAGPLEESLIVRPTSETIMYHMFSQWIQSHRDLPLLVNQWANVVRWEMRPRPFLRTSEFLWQEGHTVHALREEAEAMTMDILEVYKRFMEECLAIPVLMGRKTEQEKFPGADYTTCIEAMMQDGKALQAGTSHMLGQNFSKTFEIKFLGNNGKEQYAWQTSWGVSTRVIGALIMVHGDDKGVIIPPKISSIAAVMLPIMPKNPEEATLVLNKSNVIAELLRDRLKIGVKVDDRDERIGARHFEWEKKGVPVRIEIGLNELKAGNLTVVRRDTGDKVSVSETDIVGYIEKLMEEIQSNLFDRATKNLQENSRNVDSWNEFQESIETVGGFLFAHWCGDDACETAVKEKTKATIRCIPFDQKKEEGECILCGKKSSQRVAFAKAY